MLLIVPTVSTDSILQTVTRLINVWRDSPVRPLVPTQKVIVSIAILFAVGVSTFLSGAVFAQWPQNHDSWPNTTSADGRDFRMEIGGKFMNRRGDTTDLPLLLDSVTNQVLFGSTDATDLDTGPGAEVRIGFKGPRYKTKWEIRSFLANWDNQYSFDQPNLMTAFNSGLQPETLAFGYDSNLYSLELNMKRNTIPGLTLLCGPRVLSLGEDYEFTFTGTGPPVPFRQTNTYETRNTLYGFQVGYETNTPVSRRIHINTFGKIGGYLNPTRFRSTTVNTLGASSSTDLTKTNGSGVAELGVRVYCEVLPGHAHMYAGYELFGADGVALAPAQFLTTPSVEVETTSTLFSETVTFGMSFSY